MFQSVQELLVQPGERLCRTRKLLSHAFGFILLRPLYHFLSVCLFVDFMADLQAYEILIDAIGKNDRGWFRFVQFQLLAECAVDDIGLCYLVSKIFLRASVWVLRVAV